MTDVPSPTATDDAPPGLEQLLGAIGDDINLEALIAPDDPVPVAAIPLPAMWEQLFARAEAWLAGDGEEKPSAMMRIAAKGVVTWGRTTVSRDPEAARLSFLDLVRDVVHTLHYTSDELGIE